MWCMLQPHTCVLSLLRANAQDCGHVQSFIDTAVQPVALLQPATACNCAGSSRVACRAVSCVDPRAGVRQLAGVLQHLCRP